VAFATHRALPQLTPDDRLVLDYLNAEGVAAEAAVWDSTEVAWKDFDCVVIRSCWDYHRRPAEFAAWVSLLETTGVDVWNPPDVIRWNMDKSYLSELERNGISVAATVWLEKNSTVDLGRILSEKQWSKVVIKPTISATAFETWISTPNTVNRDDAAIHWMLQRSGVMIQKFIEELPAKGEWSLVFFNKEYSHAVLKRARQGEFRVQNEYGGYLEENVSPKSSLIERAQQIVEFIDGPLLYARVDGVEVDGRFMLMELELIEPFLFFNADSQSVARFAQALTSVRHPVMTANGQRPISVAACN
jgi:glutathione synthase/RimK-type ligase-like ATP-grasp enzyme